MAKQVNFTNMFIPLYISNIEDLKQAASYANDLLTYISDKDSSYIAAAHYIAFYFNSKLSVAYKELAKDHTFLPAEENHFLLNSPNHC